VQAQAQEQQAALEMKIKNQNQELNMTTHTKFILAICYIMVLTPLIMHIMIFGF